MIYIETPSLRLSSHRSDLWATQEPCGGVASFIPSAPETFHFQTRAATIPLSPRAVTLDLVKGVGLKRYTWDTEE